MQKTAKKFLSMLLALMMVLSILPTAVFATEQGTVAAPLDSIVPYGAKDDLTLLQEWVDAGKSEDNLTPEQWAQADIDGNNRLDEDDLDALTWYLENPKIHPIN